MQPELCRFTNRTHEEEQANQGQGMNMIAEEIKCIGGMRGHAAKNTVKLNCSEHNKGREHPEQQPKVTDTVDHERLDRRGSRRIFMIPEPDEEVRRQSHPFPSEEQLQQI